MTVMTGYLGLDEAWLAALPPTKPHPIENKQNHRHYERSEVISYFNRIPMSLNVKLSGFLITSEPELLLDRNVI